MYIVNFGFTKFIDIIKEDEIKVIHRSIGVYDEVRKYERAYGGCLGSWRRRKTW